LFSTSEVNRLEMLENFLEKIFLELPSCRTEK
jgi:hypothetical protein